MTQHDVAYENPQVARRFRHGGGLCMIFDLPDEARARCVWFDCAALGVPHPACWERSDCIERCNPPEGVQVQRHTPPVRLPLTQPSPARAGRGSAPLSQRELASSFQSESLSPTGRGERKSRQTLRFGLAGRTRRLRPRARKARLAVRDQGDHGNRSLREKFCFFFSENRLVSLRLVSLEGRFAVVTNVEARCGGRDVAQ